MNFPMLSVVFTEYFFLIYLLSFHHQLHHLHDFLHLNLTPYIPSRRIHMQLVSVSIYTHTDAVDASVQDCLDNIQDTRLVENSAC